MPEQDYRGFPAQKVPFNGFQQALEFYWTHWVPAVYNLISNFDGFQPDVGEVGLLTGLNRGLFYVLPCLPVKIK